MSYDLIGIRLQRGETPEQGRDRLEELAEDETPPGDAAWAEMLRTAERLAAVDPYAERFESRDGGVIEFTNDRFQVAVYEHESSVTVPYWSDGTDDPFAAPVASYLDVLRAAGFTIYDPQTEEIVPAGGAAQAVADGYRRSAEVALPALDQAIAEGERRHRRWRPFRKD
jgi:hypothetical protein